MTHFISTMELEHIVGLIMWSACLCYHLCHGSHFAGGHITWAPIGNRTEILISYRFTYTASHISCIGGQETKVNSDKIKCFNSCTGDIANISLKCTDISADYTSWASGIGEAKYLPNTSRFMFGYQGSTWVDDIYDAITLFPAWSLISAANVTVRRDTGRINHSPNVDMVPVTVHANCGIRIRIVIPVYDMEGDPIKCRLAEKYGMNGLDECAGVCYKNTQAASVQTTSDSMGYSCQINYMPEKDNIKRVFAIQIEDYNGSRIRSSVPLQLLVYVDSKAGSCRQEIAIFSDVTPRHGTEITPNRDGKFTFEIAASSPDGIGIRRILIYSNISVRHDDSSHQSPAQVSGNYSRIDSADNSSTQVLGYISGNSKKNFTFCFYAQNKNYLYSLRRCVIIVGHVDTPLGGDCSHHQKCDVTNSECVSSNGRMTCRCKQGYHDLSGVCLEKQAYGEPCNTTEACATWLAECSPGGLNSGKVCQCPGSTQYQDFDDNCVGIPYCQANTDSNNFHWGQSKVNTTITIACPVSYKGNVTRECTKDGIYLPPVYNCTLENLGDLTDLISTGKANTTEVLSNLSKIINSSSQGSTTLPLHLEDLESIESSLDLIANKIQNGTTVSKTETEDFANIINFLINPTTTEHLWKERQENAGPGAGSLLSTVDSFLMSAQHSVTSGNEIQVQKPNLVLRVAAVNLTSPSIQFPDSSFNPQWNTHPSSLKLPTSAFTGLNITSFATVIYKNLSETTSSHLEGHDGNPSEINSAVISLQLFPRPPSKLDPPLELIFSLFNMKPGYEAYCTYWNGSMGNGSGGWSTEGCVRKTSPNTSEVTCHCSHLTNFAILISPARASSLDREVLGIISIVGCSVSIVCLLITIIVHALYWRYIKGTKTVLSMALCSSLLLAYALFIGGVTQTSFQPLCRAIAALLHYIYLVVFFLMLAEGIIMFIPIVFLFHKQDHLKELLVMAFITPAVFVAISLGIDVGGYGNDEYCWLQAGSWQFWMFAGPVLLIICVNIVFIVIIVFKLHSTQVMKMKDRQQKAKTTAWTLGILLPVMGVTWLVGVFSVSASTAWLQYVFVITNSLQGLGICFFHCFKNQQLRNAIATSRNRKKLLDDINSKGTRSNPSHDDTQGTNVKMSSTTTYTPIKEPGSSRIMSFLTDIKDRAVAVRPRKSKRANITTTKGGQSVLLKSKTEYSQAVTLSDTSSDNHSDTLDHSETALESCKAYVSTVTVELTITKQNTAGNESPKINLHNSTSSDKGLLEKEESSELKYIDDRETDQIDSLVVRL